VECLFLIQPATRRGPVAITDQGIVCMVKPEKKDLFGS
jgi:hypothetical protein